MVSVSSNALYNTWFIYNLSIITHHALHNSCKWLSKFLSYIKSLSFPNSWGLCFTNVLGNHLLGSSSSQVNYKVRSFAVRHHLKTIWNWILRFTAIKLTKQWINWYDFTYIEEWIWGMTILLWQFYRCSLRQTDLGYISCSWAQNLPFIFLATCITSNSVSIKLSFSWFSLISGFSISNNFQVF